jgi:general secretion pathway protein H
LIVAMFLAGLLIGLVPPLLNRGVSATALRADARTLAAAMRSTRAQAVTRHVETVLSVDTEKKVYQGGNKARPHAFARGIRVKTVGAKSEQLSDRLQRFRFYPDGSSTGGQVTLSGAKQKVVVDLNWLTGRVAVYD